MHKVFFVFLMLGEMFGFSYQLVRPFLTYQVFSKEGDLMESVPITLPQSVVMHDFAITQNYAIFMDLSLVMGFQVYIIRPSETFWH
jgi:carotenoid cleavage dioxygenase-like enzyme